MSLLALLCRWGVKVLSAAGPHRSHCQDDVKFCLDVWITEHKAALLGKPVWKEGWKVWFHATLGQPFFQVKLKLNHHVWSEFGRQMSKFSGEAKMFIKESTGYLWIVPRWCVAEQAAFKKRRRGQKEARGKGPDWVQGLMTLPKKPHSQRWRMIWGQTGALQHDLF